MPTDDELAAFRRLIRPHFVRVELGLDVAEEVAELLLLDDPRALLGLLVGREFAGQRPSLEVGRRQCGLNEEITTLGDQSQELSRPKKI